MKKIYVATLLLAIFACAKLPAQTFSFLTERASVVSLDGLWRFHTGDNPAWASSNFDDSHWPLLRSDESWAKQGYPDYGGYAWYRFTIQVADGNRSQALLLNGILTGYQVFANGKLVGGEGSIVPNRDQVNAYLPAVYWLPQGRPGPQSLQIAIRVWHDASFGLDGGMQRPGSIAGEPAILAREVSRDRDARTVSNVASYGYCLLAWVVGLTTLVLFFSRLEDREYLWFSVLLLSGGTLVASDLVWSYVLIPMTLGQAIGAVAQAVSVVAALFFFSIVLRTPRSFWWWLACAGAAAYPIGLVLYYFRLATWGEGHALAVTLMLPADIWFIGTLAASVGRKAIPVRWLLAPAVLYYGSNLLSHLVTASVQIGWRTTRIPLDVALMSRPFSLSLSDVIRYVFVVSLLIFLVRSFSAARQEEARLSQEMEAARSIQSLMLPASSASTPGFRLESVYVPASEVGGDFFQILPGGDGSLLIVVGDVSGKGLKAAMTVSAIVGALRGCALRRPAEVLAYLNRVLFGQIGGFVTCCATLIAADGRMIIANAGHLSPYLNGEELEVASGLPLGIADEAVYEEANCELGPGGRLTYVSDGVVEARNASGQLYGFERTQILCGQSAQAIAEAARKFGQEDDITVLSVTRMAKLQAVTA